MYVGDNVTPQGFPPDTKSYPERQDEGPGRVFWSEILRYSTIVVATMGWRGASVVLVGGRGCCAHLDAS